MSDLPSVTIAVMTYRQETYVAKALEGVFSQDYPGPVEILLSDDASPDGTADALRAAVAQHYRPDRPVRVNVNRRNMGLIPHLHKVFAMAHHDFLVMMAGDDFSHPNRVQNLARLHHDTGALMVHSGFRVMDEQGGVQPDKIIETTLSGDWTLSDAASSEALFVGATAGYHKDILRNFGPIAFEDAFEDLVLGFRAALSGRIAYCPKPLVDYRVGNSLSQAGQLDLSTLLLRLKTRMDVTAQRLRDAQIAFVGQRPPVIDLLNARLQADRDLSLRIQAALYSQTGGTWDES